MSIQVQFGPEATAELRDAMRWYEQRRAGLGFSFLSAVDAAVDSLKRWPRSGAPIVGLEAFDVRRVPISSFPYHVAYLISANGSRCWRSLTIGAGRSTGAVESIRSPPTPTT